MLEVAEHTEAREIAGQEEVEKVVVADWGWEEGGGEQEWRRLGGRAEGERGREGERKEGQNTGREREKGG